MNFGPGRGCGHTLYSLEGICLTLPFRKTQKHPEFLVICGSPCHCTCSSTGVMALALAILPGKASGQKTVWGPQPEKFGFKSYLVMSCFVTWYLLMSLSLSFLFSKFRTLADFSKHKVQSSCGCALPIKRGTPIIAITI